MEAPGFHDRDGETPWHVIGAAVQGTAHRKAGLPCQDVYMVLLLPGGSLLVAVADGAGTAELADQGARCAVEQLMHNLSSALEENPPEDESGWTGLVFQAYQNTQNELFRLADELDRPVRDFATTLTCAMVVDPWFVVGQLGDGAVVAQEPGGELFSVTQAQRGEYANETFFLTQDEGLHRLEIYALNQRVNALAVMSDGLTRLALKMPSYEPHPPFFQPFFSFIHAMQDTIQAEQRLADFLASERVCARTDDDKTLVLAVRRATRDEIL